MRYNQGGKCRDISPIYRVSGGVDTIFREEKSEERYFRKYHQNISDISVLYRFVEIYRRYFEKIASDGKISVIYRRYIADFLVIFPLLHAT